MFAGQGHAWGALDASPPVPAARRYRVGVTVSANWFRIMRWCEQHAPVTPTRLLPAASTETIRAAEHATGRQWPEQLHEWFSLHDGSYSEMPIAVVLPSNEPISTAHAVTHHDELTRLWQDWTEELGGTEALTAEPAGTEVENYLPAFIPIGSSGTGDLLVVDTRAGDRYGCVLEWFNSGFAGLRWASIEAMLDCTATALEQGTDCSNWVPLVENGLLRWNFLS